MRGKSVGLLVLALGCGLVASIGITRVMAKRSSDPAGPAAETETIFVAIEDIPTATVLTPQMVRLEEWPKDKVPPTALTTIEDLQDRKAKGKIYAGEAILDNKLFEKGARTAGADMFIPPGYRSVPVKVDMVSGGSNMILPESRVDVLLFIKACPANGIPQTIVKTILQNIKVFAVNDVVNLDPGDDDSSKSLKAATISLLLTPEQTEQVILASEMGELRLVMRGNGDDATAEVRGTTSGDLLNEGKSNPEAESLVREMPLPTPGGKPQSGGILGMLAGLGKPAARTTTPPLQIPAGATEPERHEMRLVLGPEVRHVTLENIGTADGPRRWRVSEAGLGRAGFALATDNTALGGTPPAAAPPVEPGTASPSESGAEENGEETVPLDDE